MLLNSGSTVDLFKSAKWLTNITESPLEYNFSTNGGMVHTKLQGTLPGYGVVWHHPDAITNILSLNNVQDKFRVTYDSKKKNSFYVHNVVIRQSADGSLILIGNVLLHNINLPARCLYEL